MSESEVWNMPDTSPESAYQLGLMVADMVKVALEDAVHDAAAINVEEFRKGITEGFKALNLTIGADFWAKESAEGGRKKRITAVRASDAFAANAGEATEAGEVAEAGGPIQ